MPYLVIIDGSLSNASLRGTPLRLSPYADLQDARQAISWQATGGLDTTRLVIAKPVRILPGVMETSDGKPVLICNNGWTDEAFAQFIVKTWGTDADLL